MMPSVRIGQTLGRIRNCAITSAVLLLDAVMPEMLEVFERREVKKHHDGQHLAEAQLARSAVFAACREKVMLFPVFKGLRKIIEIAGDCGGIVSMYARGMSTREIVGHLQELYGIAVSPDLISTVTDAILEEVAAWQGRPLEAVYPLVFFDALRVKIRDEGLVRNKAVHIALGVRADGTKEILGLWIEQNEGAKFWLRVMNELKNRGVEDILLAVVPLGGASLACRQWTV